MPASVYYPRPERYPRFPTPARNSRPPHHRALIHRYRISGLTVGSTVPLPGVRPLAATTDGPDDVTAEVAPVPPWDATPDTPWTLTGDTFRLAVPNVGRFAAIGGTRLLLDPDPGVPLPAAVTYLLGTTLAALLYQRGGMALHGAAVALDGRAHLLLGPSGRGKSTLSAALCTLGCALLCDDVARVEPADGGWTVFADHRRTKLHDATIEALGLQHAAGDQVGDASGKRFVTLPRAHADALPLGGIITLAVDPTVSEPTLAPLDPLTSATLLLRRIYRGQLHRALIPGARLAQWTTALARTPGVQRLVRPLTPGPLATDAQARDTVHATAALVRRAMTLA